MGYLKRGITYELSNYGINNTPMIAQTKISKPIVFVKYPSEGIAFLLGCGMIMQYPFTFQQIWYGAQRIFNIL